MEEHWIDRAMRISAEIGWFLIKGKWFWFDPESKQYIEQLGLYELERRERNAAI